MTDDNWDESPDADDRAPYPGQGPYEPEESSLPWQNRERYPSRVGALWETFRLVLFDPSRAFSRINVEGSLAGSMLYVVILGSIGGYIGLAWQLLARALGLAFGGAAQGEANLIARVGGLAVFAVLVAVLMPVAMLFGSLVSSAILHVCLLVIGGANRSFEATYAVVAYCAGSTSVLAIIPFCGGLICAIWNIVVEIIGLREAHKTTTGRAALAVLAPAIVCCGLFVVLWMAVVAAAVAAVQ